MQVGALEEQILNYSSFFFYYLNIGGMDAILGPLGTTATPGLLYLPRVIVRMEKLVE
jgi:hypothetical protein